MQKYAVVFAPSAEEQLDQLYLYIESEAGGGRAESYIDRIVGRCRSLQTFSLRGTKRDDIRPNLRTMGYARRVTIAFSVDETRHIVEILGIFYGGQDVDVLLGGAHADTDE